MNATALIGGAIVGVVVVAIVIWARIRPGKTFVEQMTDLNEGVLYQNDVGTQLRAGNKIQAIKLYRQQTGVGLREAKEAVERMERGLPVEQVVEEKNENAAYQQDEIRAQIRAGHKIQAIKLYREQTGMGLPEAKEAVERMEREMGYTRPD